MVSEASWTVSPEGFHVDPRWRECGFVGGVTTRTMGDMAQAANRSRALELAGLGHLPAYAPKQVHGRAVLKLEGAAASAAEADGWIVAEPGRVALVYAADCMPIFIWSRGGEAAAVLHSGWKGTKVNIAAAGVEVLAHRGLSADGLQAAIGPRIGACCYAVGDDFAAVFRAGSLQRRGGRLYLDLAKEARAQLIEAGLPPEAISADEACTACSGLFFSFRREKSGTRMMGFLAKRVA